MAYPQAQCAGAFLCGFMLLQAQLLTPYLCAKINSSLTGQRTYQGGDIQVPALALKFAFCALQEMVINEIY